MAMKRKFNLPPLQLKGPPQKTLDQLWDEYGPLLNEHYDIMQYANAKIVKVVEAVSKGANKVINMEGDSNGNIYATANYINAKELENHMKILVQFFKKPRQFDIPLLYKEPWRLVSSYINFDVDSDILEKAKMSKHSLKYCAVEGQFLSFMLKELNMVPLDVESYISRDTDKLVFLDFGEVRPKLDSKAETAFINEYLDGHLIVGVATPEVRACIFKEMELDGA